MHIYFLTVVFGKMLSNMRVCPSKMLQRFICCVHTQTKMLSGTGRNSFYISLLNSEHGASLLQKEGSPYSHLQNMLARFTSDDEQRRTR